MTKELSMYGVGAGPARFEMDYEWNRGGDDDTGHRRRMRATDVGDCSDVA